ncbi:MAG TPA: hybrid sensor histidine kinase/response regulator [Anaerolineae bacterium]|nr:hybrid sensor histidine kinase/response regulator [Anaerolineae bacterium]
MSKQILIVDDDLLNRKILTASLKKNNYAIKTATNGQEALDILHTTRINAVLLDLNMPIVNGYQVLEQMKADEKLATIPVLITSNLDTVDHIVRCLQMGASDYLPKPFNPILLKSRLESALAQIDLQEKIAELDAFAHTVAHDIKTPLTTITMSSTLLRRNFKELSSTNKIKMLTRIESNSIRISGIVDSLLLLATINNEDISVETINMDRIIVEVQNRLDSLIQQHQPTIVLPNSWPSALGHTAWITKVWANYLSNALKYSGPNPHIELGATPQNNTIRFWIRDNGPGIPPDYIPNLFLPFSRVTQLNIEGHGLGLSIVHRIIKKLNGQVGVDSTLGHGATFWFTLPAN